MSTSLVLQPGRIGISVNKMQGYLNLMQQRGMIQTRWKTAYMART